MWNHDQRSFKKKGPRLWIYMYLLSAQHKMQKSGSFHVISIPFHIDKWQQKLSRHRQTSTDHWSRWIAWHMPMQTIPNSEIILACWERIERIYWRWKIMAAPFRLKQKNLEVNSHFGCVLALDAGRCPMTGTNPNRQLKRKRPVPDFEETHPSLLNFLDFCQQKKQTPCSKGTHKVTFIQQQIPCLQVQWLPWRWSLTMGPDMMRSDPINGWLGFFPSDFFLYRHFKHFWNLTQNKCCQTSWYRHCLHASSTWVKQASMVHLI